MAADQQRTKLMRKAVGLSMMMTAAPHADLAKSRMTAGAEILSTTAADF
jgi:hypothetical protein